MRCGYNSSLGVADNGRCLGLGVKFNGCENSTLLVKKNNSLPVVSTKVQI